MATRSAKIAMNAKPYTIEGLQVGPTMIIDFLGQRYDLANLTEDQAAFLLQHPDQVPYLKSIQAGAPAPAK